MPKRRPALAAALALAILLAPAAAAQPEREPPVAPPVELPGELPVSPQGEAEVPRPPAPPPSWWVGARLGAFDMVNAADSYDAVFGEPMPQIGLAAEVDFRHRWRLALSIDYGTVDGEQVILADPPLGTGIDEELTLVPVHLTLAWRLRPRARWGGYVGAGPSFLSWKDESELGTNSGTDFGASLAAGLRRTKPASPWAWGAELRWSTFPNALPDTGTAGAFGEDDPGGLAITVTALRRLR
ncbi:MAG TPA: hypothetical protein VHQ65_00520 [Thermoanaerobaculia bacterium]|nr:hypothetical protein [Thermoanaerobaculia bacterium]